MHGGGWDDTNLREGPPRPTGTSYSYQETQSRRKLLTQGLVYRQGYQWVHPRSSPQTSLWGLREQPGVTEPEVLYSAQGFSIHSHPSLQGRGRKPNH